MGGGGKTEKETETPVTDTLNFFFARLWTSSNSSFNLNRCSFFMKALLVAMTMVPSSSTLMLFSGLERPAIFLMRKFRPVATHQFTSFHLCNSKVHNVHPLANMTFLSCCLFCFCFFALRSDKQDLIKYGGCMQKKCNAQIITGLSLMGCLEGVGGEKNISIYELKEFIPWGLEGHGLEV